ncbi:MAG: phosphatidylglycerophosphatase A [Myxococcales bacterium]|nr:phosphatidylglycerophosphatase A [Myxococcales bacterium]
MDSALVARLLATWFGCGRSPVAPGTVGTLGALPLHLALRALGPLPYAAAVIAITAAGTWAAQREAERLGEDDPQSVVVDEVAGVLLALLIARGTGWKGELLAVALFRVFDIWKPGPVDGVQHLEPKGVGIMADDVLAGALAGLSARWLAR